MSFHAADFIVFFLMSLKSLMPSVLWHCQLDIRNGIRPVKTEWWSTGVVICLERGANDLHMVQLIPLPHIISCFIKIQNGSAFLVPAYPGCPGKRPLNGCSSCLWNGWLCVYCSVHISYVISPQLSSSQLMSFYRNWTDVKWPSLPWLQVLQPISTGLLAPFFMGWILSLSVRREKSIQPVKN